MASLKKLIGLGVLAASLAISASATPLPKPDANGAYYTWTPAEQLVGYRNIEKIFPTRTIKRGDHVMKLPVAPHAIKIAYTYEDTPWTTGRFMKETNAAAVLVLHKGRIVLEKYRLGYTMHQRWTSFSVAKSMSSTLVGAAIKDGAIKSLEDPVTEYIPALKGTAYDGVTVRNLLNMTSGVKWNEDYADPNADVAKIRAEKSVNGSDPIVTYMARMPREAPPGTKFVYKTGETHLVGALVRAATHKKLADYLSEKVWAPVGMQRDAVWILDPANDEYAGCCISATARDFARFGYFFMHGAKVNGQSIVPDNWIKMATTTSEPGKRANGGYGFQWWTLSGNTYRGVGIFGQMMFIDPDRDLVVIVQSAWPSATNARNSARMSAFAEAVQKAVGP